jgi:amino acid adenylation domain-containing protein
MIMKDPDFSIDNAFAVSQYAKEKNYWLEKLSGELVRSFFPCDRTGRYTDSERGQKKSAPEMCSAVKINIPAEISSKLIARGTGKNHRIHMVLLGVLTVLLGKYTGSSDIILGTPIYKQEKQGRFINTVLPLRYYVPQAGDITFRELLLQVRQGLMEAVEHQNYPMETLVYQLDLSFSGNGFPLFDTVLLLENIHHKEYIQHVHCNMVFSFLRIGENITGKVEYNPLRYETGTMERIVRHFTCLLEAALDGMDVPLSGLELLTPGEKHRLLYTFNRTAVDYPGEKTLSRLFAEQVNASPDSIAFIDLGKDSRDPHYLTYRELSRRVDLLVHLLYKKGVKPDTIVALSVREPSWLITGILAALTAGGAYMPIDPDYPWERVLSMLKDSAAAVLLTVGPAGKTGILPEEVKKDCEVIFIDSIIDTFKNNDSPSFQPLDSPGSSSNRSTGLAYVLYTSGSTGRPKGVMIINRNVVRLVKNTNYIDFSGSTRILQNGSPVFDAITFEIWGTLLNGGQLVLAGKKFILDVGKLGDAIKRYRINTMLLTPVFFNQLVRQDSSVFNGLEWLIVGGDVLSPGHINQARKANKCLNLVNAYGPTENAVISTSYLIDRDFELSIPIGRPINNSTVYILDANNGIQPVGVVGELCVGGEGVGRGYMNDPELTAEKFCLRRPGGCFSLISHYPLQYPINPSPYHPIYRTGDMGRWLPEGIIEFLGRQDFQVKIRGHRIELGEIESRLLTYDSIRDVIVVLIGESEQRLLCAYFAAERETTSQELKDYLKEWLPGYMIPTYFVQLERLPCTPVGKIDRKALPDPRTMAAADKIYQPPVGETEAAIVQTWSEVLEIDPAKISTSDNFFELGGNSINILKVRAQLCKHFGSDISLSVLFLYPTVKELAANIKTQAPGDKLESIVKLNRGQNKKNIFIFHPLHGMVYPFKELARLLENKFDVYGIQARGLTREAALPANREEMLEEYLKEIRQVQPCGPYIFSGFCIGNALAYDSARVLEDQGEEIETLILLDVGTLPPERFGLFYACRFIVEEILFYIHINIKKSQPDYSSDASQEQKRLMDRVKANNQLLFRDYRNKRIIGSPIIHTRAKENLSQLLFQGAWHKLTKGRVQLFKCPGNHHNMLAHPNVEKMAEIFKESI